MTNLPLSELEAALKKATVGTWEHLYVSGKDIGIELVDGSHEFTKDDHALIVLLRNNADAIVEAAKKAEECRHNHGDSARIVDRCPACGSRSLFVGSGGYLTCGVLGCKNPATGDVIEESARKLAEAEREVAALKDLNARNANEADRLAKEQIRLNEMIRTLQAENAALRKAGQRVRNAHALECPNPECATMLAWDAVYSSSPPKSAGTKEEG